MKKLSFVFAIAALLGFSMAFVGCANDADSPVNPNGTGTENGTALGGGGITPESAYEEKLTISLSDSEKLSAAGAASLAAGTDVSDWFNGKTVAASVSASVSDGFVGFKAEIVSATETSLVIKVTGTAGTKKCSVTLSITIPATVTASGKPVVKENVKTVGIGVEPTANNGNSEILQTEHVKIEKVKGGLKFIITRPSESCYDPKAVLRDVTIYNNVGAGNGDYNNPHYGYVGAGNGSLTQKETEYYKYVGKGNGRFNLKYEYVGLGNGSYVKAYGTTFAAGSSGGSAGDWDGWTGDNFEYSVFDYFYGSERLSEAGVAALTPGTDVSDWFTVSVADGFTSFKAEVVSASIFSLTIKVTGTGNKEKCPFYLSMTIPASFKANGQEDKRERVLTVSRRDNWFGNWLDDHSFFGHGQQYFYGSRKLSEAGVAALTQGTDVSDWFAVSVADGFTSFKAEIDSASINSLSMHVTGTGDKQKCPFYLSMTIPASFMADGEELKLGKVLTVSVPESEINGNYALSFNIDWFEGADTDVNTYSYVGDGKGEYELLSCDDVGEGKGAYSKNTSSWYVSVGAGNGDYEYVADYVGEGNGSYKKQSLKYYGGLGSVQITGSAGMPVAKVIVSNDKNVFECVYPLCDSGKRYDFEVNIEPLDRNLMQFFKLEKLSVVVDDGIGEIDFSKNAPNVDLTYDGEKPIVKFSNWNLPSNLKNARTGIDYWFTDQRALKNGDVDWDTPGALVFVTQYYAEGVVTECTDATLGGFKAFVDMAPYDTLYAYCYVEFEVPESSGLSWRTQPFTALTKIR